MAKTFNQIILDAKETVYSAEANVLTVLAKANPMVTFQPQLMPNGVKAEGKYLVQRRKRPSVNTVANAKVGTTAAALAALDQFSEGDWETVEVLTGVLKSVGFKHKFEDSYDFSSNDQHAKDALYQVGEIAAERKKALNTLLLSATHSGAALPAYAKDEVHVWDAISAEIVKLAQVDDEFKDVQGVADFITVVSPTVARELSKEMGTTFNSEAPIANTGLTSGKSINGTPVIVDSTLVKGSVYIIHNEAIGFKSVLIDKDIDIDLGLVEFTGKFFYDVMAVVDAARVSKIAATSK